jgi:hypothetical protein
MSYSQYNPDIPLQQPGKKPYAAMRVANLGGFSDLTQQMIRGSYGDMRGSMLMRRRRRRRI